MVDDDLEEGEIEGLVNDALQAKVFPDHEQNFVGSLTKREK